MFKSLPGFAVIILLFGINIISQAQIEVVPGYIVTNNRDTVKGFMENRSKGSDFAKCYFRKDMSQKSTVYTPKEVVAFGLNNLKYYETITIKDIQGKDQLVFATILLPGRASLFRYKKEMYLRHDSLGTYLLHFNTVRDVVGMNKVRGLLNFIFADCKKGKRITSDSIVLTDEKITEMTRNYNVCKNSNVKLDSKKKVPALKGNVSVVAGVDIMDLKFATFSLVGLGTLSGAKFQSSSAPTAGLSYGLTFPRFTKNFSVFAEMSYFKSSITGQGSSQEASGLVIEDVAFSATYVKTVLGAKVLFPTRTFTPFVKAGISFYSASDFVGTRTRTDYINNTPIVTVSNPWTSGNQNGIWIGAGVQRRLSDKLAFSLETRFDRTTGYNGPSPGYPLNGTHLTFLVGVVF